MITHKVLTAMACAALLAGCQVGGSTVSDREGYFTWVDEQGRARYSPIVEAPPVDSPDESVSGKQVAGEEERKGASASEEFNTENYPDAEALRRKGYVRDGDRQPYFTWRDAEGNVRTSPYRPDTRTEEEKAFVVQPADVTPASVYRANDIPGTSEPVAGYDPNAFAILGIEGSSGNFLERFSKTCCQALDAQNHERWQEGREFGVYLTEGSPVHKFLTGESPYQLIALPHGASSGGQVLRMRSYASNGVFIPSVVFLDSELTPVRLVTDLVSDFEPENWHRRGYLEVRISVSVSQKERWMLIFTRDEDTEGQTVIDTRRGPRKIPHASVGEIGLYLIQAQ